jgi:hypothetical protein
MKTFLTRGSLAAVAVVAAGCLFLSACGPPTGYKQADKTGEGIAQFHDEIVNLKKNVDETLHGMSEIELTADTDARKAFEKFSRSVNELADAADKAQKRGAAIKADGEAYFLHWEQQLAEVQNPEIKRLAEVRKAKLRAAFDGIKRTAVPLREQFTPWLSDLKDLQTYLSNDLSIGGVDAARSQFAKSKAGGAEVVKSIDALVAELNSILAALAPVKGERR